MKTSRIIILILAAVALVLTIAPAAAGQKSEPGVAVPKLPAVWSRHLPELRTDAVCAL